LASRRRDGLEARLRVGRLFGVGMACSQRTGYDVGMACSRRMGYGVGVECSLLEVRRVFLDVSILVETRGRSLTT